MEAGSLVVGSDHAGYELKESLAAQLRSWGYQVEDVGVFAPESVDYPDYAARVASLVSSGEFGRGLLVCGSGVGVAIVANKFAGVRAANCGDEETARLSRAHNDANVLTVGARRVGAELAGRILEAWLETAFEHGRHSRRVEKIKVIEDGLEIGTKGH